MIKMIQLFGGSDDDTMNGNVGNDVTKLEDLDVIVNGCH